MSGNQMLHGNSATHSCIPQVDDQRATSEEAFPIPPMPIHQGEYYAVDYVKNFYIGKVLDATAEHVRFKFLYKVGATNFHWPRREDVD